MQKVQAALTIQAYPKSKLTFNSEYLLGFKFGG